MIEKSTLIFVHMMFTFKFDAGTAESMSTHQALRRDILSIVLVAQEADLGRKVSHGLRTQCVEVETDCFNLLRCRRIRSINEQFVECLIQWRINLLRLRSACNRCTLRVLAKNNLLGDDIHLWTSLTRVVKDLRHLCHELILIVS